MKYAILALVLVGCASTRTVMVTSTAPAQIDMDGITVCETTPCEVSLRCRDPYMWQAPNSLSATPKGRGMIQQRSLSACDVPTGSRVNFDMGVTVEAPVQRQEITIKDKRKLAAPKPR